MPGTRPLAPEDLRRGFRPLSPADFAYFQQGALQESTHHNRDSQGNRLSSHRRRRNVAPNSTGALRHHRAPSPLPVSPQPLPTNANGTPNFHSIVVLQPAASSHASSAFWWKAAAIGVLVLFGAATCTGFVLASLYAPTALPYIALGIAFLTFSETFGITRASRWCMKQSEDHEKHQAEDAYIEEKLKTWEGKSFEDVLREPSSDIADHILDHHELLSRPADLNRLKTTFARFLYLDNQEKNSAPYLNKTDTKIQELNEQLADKERQIEQASDEARLDLSELCTESARLEHELREQETLRNKWLEKIAYNHRSRALLLYILKRPLNRIPESSTLTWYDTFLAPVKRASLRDLAREDRRDSQRELPYQLRRDPRLDLPDGLRTDPRLELPYEHRPHRRLPNGRHLTIDKILRTPVTNLSETIERAFNSHLEKADHRSSATATGASMRT